MNNLRVKLMRCGLTCTMKNYGFTSFDREIHVSGRMLTDGDRKSEFFSRLRNIFGRSSAVLNHVMIERTPNYIDLPTRGVADQGFKNRKPLILDSSGQKLKKQNNTDKKEKKVMTKIDWGVKVPDEQVETDENVEEHVPKYVLKQKWGVNLLEPIGLEQRRATNTNVISRFDNVMQSDKKITRSSLNTEMEVMNESSSPTIDTTNNLSIPPTAREQDDSLKSLREQDLKHQMAKKLDMDGSRVNLNNMYPNSKLEEGNNVSGEINREDEIIAWKNVIVRTREHIKKMAQAGKVKPPEIKLEEPEVKFSILPEPPRPKLDIAAVKTTELYSLIDSYMDPSEPPTAKDTSTRNNNKESTEEMELHDHPWSSPDWGGKRKSPADNDAKRVMTVDAEQPLARRLTICLDTNLIERDVIATTKSQR